LSKDKVFASGNLDVPWVAGDADYLFANGFDQGSIIVGPAWGVLISPYQYFLPEDLGGLGLPEVIAANRLDYFIVPAEFLDSCVDGVGQDGRTMFAGGLEYLVNPKLRYARSDRIVDAHIIGLAVNLCQGIAYGFGSCWPTDYRLNAHHAQIAAVASSYRLAVFLSNHQDYLADILAIDEQFKRPQQDASTRDLREYLLALPTEALRLTGCRYDY